MTLCPGRMDFVIIGVYALKRFPQRAQNRLPHPAVSSASAVLVDLLRNTLVFQWLLIYEIELTIANIY